MLVSHQKISCKCDVFCPSEQSYNWVCCNKIIMIIYIEEMQMQIYQLIFAQSFFAAPEFLRGFVILDKEGKKLIFAMCCVYNVPTL